MSLASKLDILRERAALFAAVREFFAMRGVLEVDVPALSPAAPIDLHIDVMEVSVADAKTGYLHTSPEYGMKRLLAEGIGDIYQMSHVFRRGEVSALHNPEFTMVEWYRHKCSFFELIDETCVFIALFLGELGVEQISYREAMQTYLGIDYSAATREELLACAEKHNLGVPKDAVTWDKDTLLQLLMSFCIEPHLGKGKLSVVHGYPGSQAALARRIYCGGEEVAERFEIYFDGIELANGYHELTDVQEQRERLAAENNKRVAQGKEPLPVDEEFLRALEKGIPDCCGVAVGFDRLLMLRRGVQVIGEVMPFAWKKA